MIMSGMSVNHHTTDGECGIGRDEQENNDDDEKLIIHEKEHGRNSSSSCSFDEGFDLTNHSQQQQQQQSEPPIVALPPGAEHLVKLMAAERILHIMLRDQFTLRSSSSSFSACHDDGCHQQRHYHGHRPLECRALQDLIQQFPSLCRKRFAFVLRGDDNNRQNNGTNNNINRSDPAYYCEYYPLEVVLRFQPSLALVQTMVAAFPQALLVGTMVNDRNNGNDTYAMAATAAVGGTRDFDSYQQQQDGSTTFSFHRRYRPIDAACRYEAGKEVVEYLVQRTTQLLTSPETVSSSSPPLPPPPPKAQPSLSLTLASSNSRNGWSPLHWACRMYGARGRRPSIAATAANDGKSSTRRQQQQLQWTEWNSNSNNNNANNCDENGDEKDSAAAEAVVLYLLQQYPHAAGEAEQLQGCYPLHLAILAGSPRRHVLEALVTAHPPALTATDDHDRTPLHYALRHQCSLEIVRYLYEATAMQHEKQRRRQLDIVEEGTRRDVSNVDDDGFYQTALKMACAFSTVDVVHYLLGHQQRRQEQFDDTATSEVLQTLWPPPSYLRNDHDGATLLHVAVINFRHHHHDKIDHHNGRDKGFHCCSMMVEFLAQQFPWMVMAQDLIHGRTPLHWICTIAVKEEAHKVMLLDLQSSLIRILLRHDRKPLFLPDRHYELPLHVARRCRLNRAILELLARETQKGMVS